MFKATVIFFMTFFITILLMSVLALNIENFIFHGFSLSAGQLSLPEILFPIAIVKERGFSIGIVVAAMLAGALHRILVHRLFVEGLGWVNEEQYHRLIGKKS